MTSIFSAGNTYTYCAIRTLYSLALEGRAPRFLTHTTRNGVPIYCFVIVMIFPILSFLQCGSNSSVVINWFSTLVTAGGKISYRLIFFYENWLTNNPGLINYITICITFIFYHRACKAQGVDRRSFSYFGRFQPYCAWLGLVWMTTVTIFYGYPSFKPWNVQTFWQNYTMQIVIPCLFILWKIFKRTKFVKPHEADLVWERPLIDAYEASFMDEPVGFWREVGQMFGWRRIKGGNDKRRRSVVHPSSGTEGTEEGFAT